ncbi:MAG: hypothetical protein HRT88_08300 [Lentisphaeraceae bacterium]|nr:hypothetical protein [Lentisphaeraceae bacterium]
MEPGLAIILCVAGIICVALEVYLPGGIIGSIGAIAILTSIFFAYQHSPGFGTMLLVCAVAGSVSTSWFSFKYLTKSPGGRKALLLDTNIKVPEEKHISLLDKEGEAVCDLRPTGRISIDDEPYDAQSRGEYVEKGALVKVIAVEADHVFVKEIKSKDKEE